MSISEKNHQYYTIYCILYTVYCILYTVYCVLTFGPLCIYGAHLYLMHGVGVWDMPTMHAGNYVS